MIDTVVPDLGKRLIEAHDMVSTILSCTSEISFDLLSEVEKASIDEVIRKLKSFSVSEIIEASHQETGWKTYSDSRSFIPYEEAFDLKLI